MIERHSNHPKLVHCLPSWLSGASGGLLNNWHQSEDLCLKLCHCQRPRLGTVNSTQSKGKIRSLSSTIPPSSHHQAVHQVLWQQQKLPGPKPMHIFHQYLPIIYPNPNVTCESVSWLVQLSKLFQGGSFPSSKATHFDSPGKDTFQPTAEAFHDTKPFPPTLRSHHLALRLKPETENSKCDPQIK